MHADLNLPFKSPLYCSDIGFNKVWFKWNFLYVTVFDKTRLPHTRTEIQFIAYHENHTLSLSTRTNDGAIDGQVCFHRQYFDDPV